MLGRNSTSKFGSAAITAVAVIALAAWLMLRPGDEDAWREASAANTQEAYELYVSRWKNGDFVEQANDRIANFKDESAWREAVDEDTSIGYALYRLNESGKYVKQAAERQAILVEAADWERAGKLGTHKAYAEYARRWPDGANIAAAKARLRMFDLRSKYRNAVSSGTIRALQSFITSHPDAPDAAAAGERIEALKQDDTPYLAARMTGSQTSRTRAQAVDEDTSIGYALD